MEFLPSCACEVLLNGCTEWIQTKCLEKRLNGNYTGMLWAGLVWWGLIGFYGISTIIGYLMSNPVFTYTPNTYDLKSHFVDTFLNESELILLYIVQWFQVFLSNMNISIYCKSFICAQLNGFKYCYVTVTM